MAGALVAMLDHKNRKEKKLHPKNDRLIKLEGTWISENLTEELYQPWIASSEQFLWEREITFYLLYVTFVFLSPIKPNPVPISIVLK